MGFCSCLQSTTQITQDSILKVHHPKEMFFDIFVHDHVLYIYICLERMFIMSEILKSSPIVCQISQNAKTNVFLKLQILFCSCWSWVRYNGKISPAYNFNKRNLLISSSFLIHCGERKKVPMTVLCLFPSWCSWARKCLL